MALLALAVCVLVSTQAFAAVFIVPEDRELVQKADGIVIGVIVDSAAQARDDGHIETIYSVRIERVLKGGFERDAVVEVASPGGIAGKRMTAVVGAAHFEKDQRVLLFLSPDRGTWTPTDMTLGKFRFVTSTGGHSLLVRDAEDIVGFDREMRTHVERIRREAEFLKFIEGTIRGRKPEANYFVAPGETVALPDEGRDVEANDAFRGRSYAIHFGVNPGRWPVTRMTASIAQPFFKNSAQNASGLGDGGVSMITNSLNAWTNDCFSHVNIPYGGTTALLKDGDDGVNTVVWNDPGNHIAGAWGGSGVVATAFMSGDALGAHPFDGDSDWVDMSDSDVVVQNGLTGAESFVATAMTHEIGHAIGLRHSNTHHNGGACDVNDECTTSAVMTSSILTNWNFSLQPWDQNAIRALYPVADQCSVPVPAAPTGLSATATNTTTVTLSWNASATATSYRVFRRGVGETLTEIGTTPTTGYTDSIGLSADSAYLYVVRATNAGGDSADSSPDIATTILFTDPSIGLGSIIRASHFSELRSAVNAVRDLADLGTFNFGSPAPAPSVAVHADHLDDLRGNLSAARAALGLSALSLTDPVIVPGTTGVKAIHVTQLRNGVL
jgi:hypothetical protein